MTEGKLISIIGGWASGQLPDGRYFNAPIVVDNIGTLRIDMTHVSSVVPAKEELSGTDR